MNRGSCRIEPLEPRRLLAAGAPDSSFGSAGTTAYLPDQHFTDLVESSTSRLFNLPDGRLFAAGEQNFDPFFQRFLPTGAVDSSFSSSALHDAVLARIDRVGAVAQAADGRILIGSQFFPSIARITDPGRIDPHFGRHGTAHLPLEGAITAIGTLPDGRILVSGTVHREPDDGGQDDSEIGLVMLTPEGHVDTRFGTNGVVTFGALRQFQDALFPFGTEVNVEQFFPLTGGRFLYLRRIDFGESEFSIVNDSDLLGIRHSATIQGAIFNLDGSIDSSFVFDRTNVLAATTDVLGNPAHAGWLLPGAVQSSDGSVQLLYVQDDATPIPNETPGNQHTPQYDLYSTTLAADGTLAHRTLIAQNVSTYDLQSVRQGNGDVLLLAGKSGDNSLTRYHPDGTRDNTFTLDPTVKAKGNIETAILTNDGQILTAFENPSSPRSGQFLAKIQTGRSPTGVFAGGPIRQPRTSAYRFTITWHDDVGIDVSSLSSPAAVVIDLPDGTTRTAVLDSTTPSTDGTTVTARYHFAAPGGEGWGPVHNGVYHVRIHPHRIFDTLHHAAAPTTLGRFFVAIAA